MKSIKMLSRLHKHAGLTSEAEDALGSGHHGDNNDDDDDEGDDDDGNDRSATGFWKIDYVKFILFYFLNFWRQAYH